MSVSAPQGDTLALAGPPDVDSAYQVFFNGQLLGGAGKFTVQHHRLIASSHACRCRDLRHLRLAGNEEFFVIAFRVWMGPWNWMTQKRAYTFAPALGETDGVSARYQIQWLETVRGYIVEVLEAALFLLLAVMTFCLIAFDRQDHAYLWLSAAMVLTALMRANQAFSFGDNLRRCRSLNWWRLFC